jgi:hypothetical protein
MKTNRLKSTIIMALAVITYCANAQTVKETTQPLSKKAQKGFVNEVTFPGGNTLITYKIGGDKKKNELFFESYSFDGGLKFLETKNESEPKIESKPDRKQKYLGAWVGGSSSFDVLSMKLKVFVQEENQKWDYQRQRYVIEKVLSSETVKLKTEAGRSYMGVASFRNDETSNLLVMAYPETKDKNAPKDYVFLSIDYDGNVKETKVDITGAYSLVYCQEIAEQTAGKSVGKQDFILLMAPKKGTAAATKYVYLHYDINGALKNKVEFESPSSNLLINSADVKNGEVFLSGMSTKSQEFYGEVFTDYASIRNPGADENMQLMRYNKRAREEMDNFHLLKFSGNKMVFATTAKVDEFKAKKRTAPNEKAGSVYKGQKFSIQSFEVTPANEFLITGQLSLGYVMAGGGNEAFGDVVCFHFDSKGNLKAQYAIDKIFEDKKSEIFEMSQKFYVTGDGKYAYWEIMEVKGFTGYANFVDAYNGNKTFYASYFPRITKIDLEKATLGEFKILGGKKNFINKKNGMFFDANTLTATYVGHDEDSENLWIGQVTFN